MAITVSDVCRLEAAIYPEEMQTLQDYESEDLQGFVVDGEAAGFYFILEVDAQSREIEVWDIASLPGFSSGLLRRLIRTLRRYDGYRIIGEARVSTSYPVVLGIIQRGYLESEVPVILDQSGSVVGLDEEPTYPFGYGEPMMPFRGIIRAN